MNFEWDENKRQSNIKKHGIDFSEAVKIFEGVTYIYRSKWSEYDEERFVAVGSLGEYEIAVVYTLRGGNIRIISARRARDIERTLYYKEAGNKNNEQ